MGDLSSRRGRIMGTDSADGYSIVKATVPQKELYKYASVLRSLTGGRGIHTEGFSHYTEMPHELEAKVIAEHKKPVEEEQPFSETCLVFTHLNLTQELERLAKLMPKGAYRGGVRQGLRASFVRPAICLSVQGYSSPVAAQVLACRCGLSACGPNWERGEMRGHAQGILQSATWRQAGCVRRSGPWHFRHRRSCHWRLCVRRRSHRLLVAIGGGAIGGIAFGGGALGGIAIGGGACGYYAFGGGAAGVHTVSAMNQDPVAMDFFQRYFPWLLKLLHR
jgi:hypothetical protein